MARRKKKKVENKKVENEKVENTIYISDNDVEEEKVAKKEKEEKKQQTGRCLKGILGYLSEQREPITISDDSDDDDLYPKLYGQSSLLYMSNFPEHIYGNECLYSDNDPLILSEEAKKLLEVTSKEYKAPRDMYVLELVPFDFKSEKKALESDDDKIKSDQGNMETKIIDIEEDNNDIELKDCNESGDMETENDYRDVDADNNDTGMKMKLGTSVDDIKTIEITSGNSDRTIIYSDVIQTNNDSSDMESNRENNEIKSRDIEDSKSDMETNNDSYVIKTYNDKDEIKSSDDNDDKSDMETTKYSDVMDTNNDSYVIETLLSLCEDKKSDIETTKEDQEMKSKNDKYHMEKSESIYDIESDYEDYEKFHQIMTDNEDFGDEKTYLLDILGELVEILNMQIEDLDINKPLKIKTDEIILTITSYIICGGNLSDLKTKQKWSNFQRNSLVFLKSYSESIGRYLLRVKHQYPFVENFISRATLFGTLRDNLCEIGQTDTNEFKDRRTAWKFFYLFVSFEKEFGLDFPFLFLNRKLCTRLMLFEATRSFIKHLKENKCIPTYNVERHPTVREYIINLKKGMIISEILHMENNLNLGYFYVMTEFASDENHFIKSWENEILKLQKKLFLLEKLGYKKILELRTNKLNDGCPFKQRLVGAYYLLKKNIEEKHPSHKIDKTNMKNNPLTAFIYLCQKRIREYYVDSLITRLNWMKLYSNCLYVMPTIKTLDFALKVCRYPQSTAHDIPMVFKTLKTLLDTESNMDVGFFFGLLKEFFNYIIKLESCDNTPIETKFTHFEKGIKLIQAFCDYQFEENKAIISDDENDETNAESDWDVLDTLSEFDKERIGLNGESGNDKNDPFENLVQKLEIEFGKEPYTAAECGQDYLINDQSDQNIESDCQNIINGEFNLEENESNKLTESNYVDEVE